MAKGGVVNERESDRYWKGQKKNGCETWRKLGKRAVSIPSFVGLSAVWLVEHLRHKTIRVSLNGLY